MRKVLLLSVALLVTMLALGGSAFASLAGPSGSIECHLSDDDCDGRIDEDPVNGVDNDGDGRVDEDPAGDAADDPGENQANCNEATSQDVGGLFYLYGGANGAEVCADGGPLPVGGRIIANTDQGGYVAADGDNTNPAPGNGYARVDQGGVHCGDESNQDSTQANQTSNTPEDCG